MQQAAAESDEQPLTAERVVREHAPRVYNLARRMLGNESDAEDVTQDVMLQVVRKLDTFRGESALSTWLHRVTVNAALAHRRKRANAHEQTTDPLDNSSQDGRFNGQVRRWAAPPEQQALDSEKRHLIEKAIACLPDSYRDVYVLADVQGLANAEIANMLDLSVPAVKSRLHRARLLMRDQLAPHFEESMP